METKRSVPSYFFGVSKSWESTQGKGCLFPCIVAGLLVSIFFLCICMEKSSLYYISLASSTHTAITVQSSRIFFMIQTYLVGHFVVQYPFNKIFTIIYINNNAGGEGEGKQERLKRIKFFLIFCFFVKPFIFSVFVYFVLFKRLYIRIWYDFVGFYFFIVYSNKIISFERLQTFYHFMGIQKLIGTLKTSKKYDD